MKRQGLSCRASRILLLKARDLVQFQAGLIFFKENQMSKDIYDFNYGEWEKKQKQFVADGHEETWKKFWDQPSGFKNLEDFLRHCKATTPPRPPWKPDVFYNKEGDILEVRFVDPDKIQNGHYAEWLNPHITLLRDQRTKEVIGVEIWGMKHVMKEDENSSPPIPLFTP